MRIDFFCPACRAEGLFIYFGEARRVHTQAAKFAWRKVSAKLDTRVQSLTRTRDVREREVIALAHATFVRPLTQISGIFDNIFEPLLTRCTGVFAHTFD